MIDPVRVLIIDDSSVVRRALTEELSKHDGIEVVGTAIDPYVARKQIAKLRPDVLTLDIEMPRMDGLTFLRALMRHHPIPTIVVSSVTPKGCATAVSCLEAGALEVLNKPNNAYSIGDLGRELANLIVHAKGSRPRAMTPRSMPFKGHIATQIATTNRVIALGASTGGTEALASVISALPPSAPGILIVQHMPAGFTETLARRLDETSAITVREATGGEVVGPGVALLAPGDRHLRLVRDGAVYRAELLDGPRVCRHRPSVEVLFESVAKAAGANAIGAILTGMGDDGAGGMLAMRQAGARTLAQDEKTCVVFGMPRAAIELDAAEFVLSLDEIPGKLMTLAAQPISQTSNGAA